MTDRFKQCGSTVAVTLQFNSDDDVGCLFFKLLLVLSELVLLVALMAPVSEANLGPKVSGLGLPGSQWHNLRVEPWLASLWDGSQFAQKICGEL